MDARIEASLAALSIDPSAAEAKKALEAALSEARALGPEVCELMDRSREAQAAHGRWAAVLELIELEMAQELADDRRAELLLQKARVLQDEVLDELGAIAAYEQALELRPADQQLHDTLVHIRLIRENWQQIVSKYVEEAETAQDRQLSTSLFLSAAEIVCRNDPESPLVEAYLARSLEIDPANRRAGRQMEARLRAAGRTAELTELLEQRATVAVMPSDRVAALVSLANVFASTEPPSKRQKRRRGLPTEAEIRAVDACRRALAIDPVNRQALDYLAQTLTERGEWAALVHLYEDALRAQPLQEQDPEILASLGQIYANELEQPGRAEDYFRRVRKLNPTHPSMLDFYRRLHRQRGEPEKLLALLENAQRAERDPEQRIRLGREMAQVAEEELGNLDRAIDIWKTILHFSRAADDTSHVESGGQTTACSSAHAEAVNALRRLYPLVSPPKWNALRELLKDEVDALADEHVDEKIALLREIAEIYRDHLQLDAMAVDTYRTMLQIKPDDRATLHGLIDHLEALGRWNDLIKALEQQVAAATDPLRKIEMLHRMAALWVDKLNNQSNAIAPLEQILTIDPVEPRALAQLREIHARRRNWPRVIDLLRVEAGQQSGPNRVVSLQEAARVATEQLGDAEQAIAIWRDLLALEPDHHEGLDALVLLYRQQERWPELIDVLGRLQLAAEPTSERSLSLLEQVADIYTNRLRDPDEAVRGWRKVLAIRPEHPKAIAVLKELLASQQSFDQLEQLLSGLGRQAELVETLTAAADRSRVPDQKVRLYRQVGVMCAEHLGNPDRAIKAFERVLAIDAADEESLRALVPLYRGTERWGRLLSCYERLLELVDDREQQLQLLAESRAICETQLGSKQLAFQWAIKAFHVDPKAPDVREVLERLAGEADAWQELVQTYSAHVDALEDRRARRDLLRHLAQICEQQLHRPEYAERFYLRMLELGEDEADALAALVQIYSAAQRWGDLADIFGRQAELVGSTTAEGSALLFRLAFLQEERLGDLESAIATYERITAGERDRLKALRALVRLYAASGAWSKAAAAMWDQIDLVETDSDRIELLFRLADLEHRHLERRDEAVGLLGRALAIDGNHQPTLSSLEQYLAEEGDHQLQVARLLRPVYERAQHFEKLAPVLELELQHTRNADAARAILEQLRAIYLGPLDDHAAAVDCAERLFRLDPSNIEACRELVVLAQRNGEFERSAAALRDGLACIDDPAVELALRWDLARTLDEHLERPVEAEQQLRRIIELDTSRTEAFELLERILSDRGQWNQLRDLLHVRCDLASDVADERKYLTRICALNEDVLGDVSGAIAAYEQMLQLQPDDPEIIRALDRHYRSAERWPDLVRLLGSRTTAEADDSQRRQLKLEQAKILIEQLNDLDVAVDLLEEVVAFAAEEQQAVAMLESLLSEPTHKRRCAQILEQVYQRTEQWPKLIEMLRTRSELSDSAQERVELFARAGRIQKEQLQDRRAAFESYRLALQVEPGARDLHEPFDALIEELGVWDEGAEAWHSLLGIVDPADHQLQIDILQRLARIQRESLRRPDLAAETYESLLRLAPEGSELARESSDALAYIYESSEKWHDLVRVMQRQVALADRSDQQQRLLERVAQIQEDLLGSPNDAILTFGEILDRAPTSPLALESLQRLYAAGGHWNELVAILRDRADRAATAEERAQLWRQIAQIEQSELHDVARATAAHLAVLDDFPADRHSLAALARIYQETENWPQLRDIYERQLAICAIGDPDHVDLLFRLADLHRRQLEDARGAVACYRTVLQHAPGHEGARLALEQLLDDSDHRSAAAAILEPLYQVDEDWSGLARVYEIRAEAADASDRQRLLNQIGQLHEQNTGDLEAAFSAYRRLVGVAEREDLVDAINALLRVTESLQCWDEVVTALEQVVERVSVDRRAVIQLRLAEISWQVLNQADRALRHYENVLELDAACIPALVALQHLYLDGQNWSSLLSVLLRRTNLESDRQQRIALLIQAGALCRRELGNSDEAIAHFETVLQLDADHATAGDALEDLYEASGRWADLARLLQTRAERTPDKDVSVRLYVRLARLCADKLGEPERALRAYRDLLRLDPQYQEALNALEGYLEHSELREAAASILEPSYVARQDWGRVVHVYERRCAATEDPKLRRMLGTRIAQLYEQQLADPTQAFSWYGLVYREEPTDRVIREQLLRLAGSLDAWDDVATLMTDYLNHDPEDRHGAREVGMIAATIFEERLYRWQPAHKYLERLLDEQPGDDEVFRQLERLLTRYERWHELIALYERTANRLPEGPERRALLGQMAQISREKLDDLGRAIEIYQRVLDESGHAPDVVAELERLYWDAGRWDDLCGLLERQISTADQPHDLIELKYRLAQIYDIRLQNLQTAIDCYQEVLEHDPNHAETIAALERLVLDRRHRFRITQILEPIYRAQDEWAKLVVICEAQLDFVEDSGRRVALLKEIASLHEHRGGGLDRAFSALCRAAREDQDRDSRAQLLADVERLAEQLDCWDEVVKLLSGIAGQCFDYGQQRDLLVRVAMLQQSRLNDHNGAIEAWRRVLTLREDDDLAMAALLDLFAASERYEDLVGMLQRRAELAVSVAVKIDSYQRIAALCEQRLSSHERATDAWRQVLSLDDQHPAALTALARLHEADENWVELIWVYHRQLEAAEDDASRRALQLALARVYEQELHDNFEAIVSLKSLVERDPHDEQAAAQLERLYRREGLWSDLLELIDLKAGQQLDVAKANALALSAGAILADEVSDFDGAIDRFELIVERDAANEAARQALETLLDQPSCRERAAIVLQQLFQRRGDMAALVRVIETRLQSETDATQRRDLLVKIAGTYEQGIGDPQMAFSAYARAFAEDPGYEPVQIELGRLADALGTSTQLVALYEANLEQVYDGQLRRLLHLKLAQMLDPAAGVVNDGDAARAEHHYRAALDSGGDDLASLQALDRLLQPQYKYDELADIIEREIAIATDPAVRVDLQVRLADARARVGDEDAAFVALREALEANPEHRGALAAVTRFIDSEVYRSAALDLLEPIFEVAADYDQLLQVWEWRLTILPAPADRVRLLERMARLQIEVLDRADQALSTLTRALAIMPDSPDVLDQLDELAGRCSGFGQLTAAAEAALAADRLSIEAQQALLLRCAEWYAIRLGETDRAEQCYRRAVNAQPDCVPALRALQDIYRDRDDFVALAEALQQHAHLEYDRERKRDLLIETAVVHEQQLNDVRAAEACWTDVFKLDPGDDEAANALVRLCAARGAWDDVVRVLADRADAADEGQTRIALKHRIGEVLVRQLGDDQRAQDAYREILDLDPTDERALLALQQIFQRGADWAALREILLQKLEIERDAAAVDTHRQLAQLCAERLGDTDEAIDHYRQLLSLDSTDRDAFLQLMRLLQDEGKWYDVLDLLRQRAGALQAIDQMTEAVQLLIEAARIWNDELDSPEAAAETLEEVLQQDAANVRALVELARLYQLRERWDLCVDALQKASQLDRHGDFAAELAYRRGCIAAARDDTPEAALEYYERALELDPDHVDAAAGIEQLARRDGNVARVAQMMEVRARTAQGRAKAELLADLGLLYARMEGQGQASVAAWERAHAADPADSSITFHLAQAYGAVGHADRAEPLIHALIEAEGGRRNRRLASCYHLLGVIAEQRGDLAAARGHYEKAQRTDSTHGPTLACLGRLLVQLEAWDDAQRIYRSMLMQEPGADWGITRPEIYSQLARVHFALGEPAKARTMIERGLESDPSNVALKQQLAALD